MRSAIPTVGGEATSVVVPVVTSVLDAPDPPHDEISEAPTISASAIVPSVLPPATRARYRHSGFQGAAYVRT
jgi:hypothetical protein